MNEELIQFSWMFRLYSAQDLKTSSNLSIEIIDPGQLNGDAGPDFFNSKIKIDGTIWAGNVEIHTNAKEWYFHNHHKDAAYNNVILHVVFSGEDETRNTLGKDIPILKLPVYEYVISNFESIKQSKAYLPCESRIKELNPFFMNNWLTNLHLERLMDKHASISEINKQNKNHWKATFFQLLFRSFGAEKNALPFVLLFKSIPLNVLESTRRDCFQTEALLFGQAGFLNEIIAEDDYYMHLCTEYRYLAKKYALVPLEIHLWKFLRLRPGSFPSIRIAQLAMLLSLNETLLSQLIESSNLKEVYSLFTVKASEYWKQRYRFNVSSPPVDKRLGKSTIHSIIINAVIPFLYAYGRDCGDETLMKRAHVWLETLPAEKNVITRNWNKFGITSSNAMESQALIQLNNMYCRTKNCIRCRIGHQIIAKPSE